MIQIDIIVIKIEIDHFFLVLFFSKKSIINQRYENA